MTGVYESSTGDIYCPLCVDLKVPGPLILNGEVIYLGELIGVEGDGEIRRVNFKNTGETPWPLNLILKVVHQS